LSSKSWSPPLAFVPRLLHSKRASLIYLSFSFSSFSCPQLAAGEMGLIPSWAINGVVASCLPAGLTVDASGNCNGDGPGSFVTDGFDNVSKLRRLRRRAEGTSIKGGDGDHAGATLTTSQQPTAEQNGRNASNGVIGERSGSDHGSSGEVFFFVSTHDDMVPPAFTEELLRARYGGDSEDELSSDDDDDDDDEGGNAGGESVVGWRAWISRFSSAQSALTAEAANEERGEGSPSTIAAGAGAPSTSPAAAPRAPSSPSPMLSPNTLLSPSIQSPNGPESPDAGAGQARPHPASNNSGVAESGSVDPAASADSAKAALSDKRAVQLDGVIKSMSMFLCRDVLCEDFTSDSGKKASPNGSALNPRASRRAARQSKREEVNAQLAAVRSTRMGVVSGGHGAFFGADRRAAATYEVFLRQIGLLNH